MTTYVFRPNAQRGLYHLMIRTLGAISIDQCEIHQHEFDSHPFAPHLPSIEVKNHKPQILFVGTEQFDKNVEIFLTHIRYWLDGYDGRLKMLRVLNTNANTFSKRCDFVFFEIWIDDKIIISGETTDSGGEGNAAREKLEDVFALLSQVYGVSIQEVNLPLVPLMHKLYQKVPA